MAVYYCERLKVKAVCHSTHTPYIAVAFHTNRVTIATVYQCKMPKTKPFVVAMYRVAATVASCFDNLMSFAALSCVSFDACFMTLMLFRLLVPVSIH